jgi:hypothetical protein
VVTGSFTEKVADVPVKLDNGLEPESTEAFVVSKEQVLFEPV